MSKSLSRISALEEISNWNTSDVLSLLRKNGLEECCKVVQKRQIDGDEFLHLTEGKLALWKSDLTRPLTWSLWRFVEELKKTPEKYIPEKNVAETQMEESLSDSGSWGTDFEDDAEDEEVEDESLEKPRSGQNNVNNNNNSVNDSETISPGQSTSRNPEFRNSLMIFRENEKTLISRLNKNSLQDKQSSCTMKKDLIARTYTNCEEPEVDYEPENETTYANCTKSDNLTTSGSKNGSNLHGKVEKSLAEQLKEQLQLRNARRSTTERKTEVSKVIPIFEKPTVDKQPQKSFLHDVAPSLKQDAVTDKIVTANPTDLEESEKIHNGDRSEIDLPRPPLMIRNFDLVANLPIRTEESEDEYEPFDEEIIEQNKRLSLARIDSKQSLSSVRQNSLESVYKTSSNASQERQDDEYEIYESITETPEDNGYYLEPIEKDKLIKKGPPPLPAKPLISRSPPLSCTGTEKKSERSPDKKSATLPHSGSSTSLTAELRATRPLPPPPDKQSYMDSPWFHNVTREQAIALIKERAFGVSHNGCFLLRPSSSHPNNPLVLVLWFKDRVYNVPVRKRPDNRYALGSAKMNEQSFGSVEEIVRFYSREELVLHTGGIQSGGTKLTDTPPK